MFQELTGYFNSIKKTQAAMKVTLHEIKKHLQGTNSDQKETRTQKSTFWSRRKKETFNQNTMKKQEFRKMRRGLGTSRTSLNIPTSNYRGARRRRGRTRN